MRKLTKQLADLFPHFAAKVVPSEPSFNAAINSAVHLMLMVTLDLVEGFKTMSDQLQQLTDDEVKLTSLATSLSAGVNTLIKTNKDVLGQLKAALDALSKINQQPNTPDLSGHLSAIESVISTIGAANDAVSASIQPPDQTGQPVPADPVITQQATTDSANTLPAGTDPTATPETGGGSPITSDAGAAADTTKAAA